MFAAADPGERFFGYFLVATRKYLAFGCENPIEITAVRRKWLWELWPKPKFLVRRDETRLIYIAGRRHYLINN